MTPAEEFEALRPLLFAVDEELAPLTGATA
jgi:hypothetical protein